MHYWRWNIPSRKPAAGNTCRNTHFNLANALGVTSEELEHARKVAFSDKAPSVAAGKVRLSNPWNNDNRGYLLNDLQCWVRWNPIHLTNFIKLAKEISV